LAGLTLVQSDLALVDLVRRKTNEDGILSLLPTNQIIPTSNQLLRPLYVYRAG
jgi:hypothetical protein